MIRKFRLQLMFVLFVFSICACTPAPTPSLHETIKESMINSFMDKKFYPLIEDIAIGIEPGKVLITIIVNEAATKEYAQGVLDSAVRQVISYSDDDGKPQKTIGKTKYDYLVGAYTSSGKEIAVAAKVASAHNLSW